MLVVLLLAGAGQPVFADSAPPKIAAPAVSTNAVPTSSTNAAPQNHGITITADINDDDDSGKKHDGDSGSLMGTFAEALVIPVVGIVATFATPVLIVFFVLYFKYRRRQETLAIVREYLSKGLPVPPQLLEDSGKDYGRDVRVNKLRKSDLTRGFQLTFIGLGVTLALYVDDPHSTTWGWGLIPMIMGIGYLLSGWVQSRSSSKDEPPPPGTPPPS
jgi:hypothetical protein